MKQTILAQRYARALFSLGKENGKVEDYCQALSGISELFQEESVRDSLVNPLYPLDVRQNIMNSIAKAAGADEVLSSFLSLLVEKKRAAILPEIAKELQTMVDEENNICHGSVVSAVEMDKKLKDKVQSTLENITGKKVVLDVSVDPSIIGGIVAKVGDLVFDGSIKTQLHGLKEAIKGRN